MEDPRFSSYSSQKRSQSLADPQSHLSWFCQIPLFGKIKLKNKTPALEQERSLPDISTESTSDDHTLKAYGVGKQIELIGGKCMGLT